MICATALLVALGGAAAFAHGQPPGHGGGPPADHGGGPPADHGGGPPADHGGGPPGDHGGGPPADHGGGPPPAANNQGGPHPPHADPTPAANPSPAPAQSSPSPGGSSHHGHGNSQPGNAGSSFGNGAAPSGHAGTPPGHAHRPRGGAGSTPGRSAIAASSATTAPTEAPVTVAPVLSTPALPPATTTTLTAPTLTTIPAGTPVTTLPVAGSTGSLSARSLPGITIASITFPASRQSSTRALTPAAAVGRGATLLSANPLAFALAGPATVARAGRSTAVAGAHAPARREPAGAVLPPAGSPTAAILHFISVIPTAVWIALAVAVGLAAVGGGAAVAFGRRARRTTREVEAATAAALTDQLTGILNRRGFLQSAQRELERARRYHHPLALAYVDVRGLKAVNDSEGHHAGDRLLEEVAALLSQSARTTDLVGRMGGDELAVLLAEQSASGAEAMTRRIRQQVPAHRAALGLPTAWDVTIGTASYPDDGETLDDLLQAADRRLYEQRGIELRAAGRG